MQMDSLSAEKTAVKNNASDIVRINIPISKEIQQETSSEIFIRPEENSTTKNGLFQREING
jgi:hypothetical protein